MPDQAKPGKRIIVACDGTWADGDNGFKRDSYIWPWKTGGRLAVPTNVTRFCRALLPRSSDGVPQIVYYQSGLGSAANWYSWLVGGYLGEGISENIREAYAFICNNYEDGDEIFLVGFSRGAFTARSIGGLIASFGLLTRKGLAQFYPIFRDWENQNDRNYTHSASYVKIEGLERPDYSDPSKRDAYMELLVAQELTRPKITVEATAVWDTVGTLGVPTFVHWPLSWFQSSTRKQYAFINTEIPPNLRYAFQALSLDDRRVPFSPTVWEQPDGITDNCPFKELRQCWFAGSHSNVGGSYPDTGQANIALAWLMQHLMPLGLSFDSKYLQEQAAQNRAWIQKRLDDPTVKYEYPRPYGCGKVYPTGSALEGWLTGAANRTPGTYTRADPATGAPTQDRLRKTCEFVHPSVRVRRLLGGRGTNDRGYYNDPWPLSEKDGWRLLEPGEDFKADKGRPEYSEADLWPKHFIERWKWVKQEPRGRLVWIAEEKLEGVEWDVVSSEDCSTVEKIVEARTLARALET